MRLLTRRTPEVVEARAHVVVGVLYVETAELQVEPWKEVGQMVVVPEGHRLAGRERLKPTDLAGESLVIAPEGKPHRASTERVLAEHDVSWDVGVEATGWQLMVRFVEYGMGVTVINDFVPVPDGLVGIPVEGFPVVDYSVGMRPDSHHAGAEWLFELILNS